MILDLKKYKKMSFLFLLSFLLLFFFLETVIITKSDNYTPIPSDAALVLGNALEDGRTPSAITKNRLQKGLELYHAGFCKTLIVSGGKGPSDEIPVAEAMQQWLLSQGIPKDNILVEDQSKNTYENILFSKALAEENLLESMIIVTSDFHIYRSMLLAKDAFPAVSGAAAKSEPSPSTLLWFLREPFSLLKYYLIPERMDFY